MILKSSLLFLINGLNPDMAHLKTGGYHYGDIAHHWFAIGLLAFKGEIGSEDRTGSNYHHAAGIASIGIGVLPVDGF
jgi:hypothetical protein